VAQENNPISHPKPGEIITAGSQYKVVWTPTKGDIVSLVLFNNFAISPYFPGASCEAEENVPGCTEVFANKTNSGSFLWNVPVNAPESDTYYLDVYVPNPGPGGPFYFMTGNFSIRPGSTTSTTTDASSSIVNPNAATDLASATASLPSTSASGSHSTSTTKGDGRRFSSTLII
jgi:hypothetical protein